MFGDILVFICQTRYGAFRAYPQEPIAKRSYDRVSFRLSPLLRTNQLLMLLPLRLGTLRIP